MKIRGEFICDAAAFLQYGKSTTTRIISAFDN
jgi:hypothetical protein